MGNQDRRVVDPPPIVELALTDFDPRSRGDVDALRNPYNAMHCLLLDRSGIDITQAGDSRDSERVVRGLTGGLMASPSAESTQLHPLRMWRTRGLDASSSFQICPSGNRVGIDFVSLW